MKLYHGSNASLGGVRHLFQILVATYSNNRYIDLKFNKTVFSVNQSDLLVKTPVALKQIVAEQQAQLPVQPVENGQALLRFRQRIRGFHKMVLETKKRNRTNSTETSVKYKIFYECQTG